MEQKHASLLKKSLNFSFLGKDLGRFKKNKEPIFGKKFRKNKRLYDGNDPKNATFSLEQFSEKWTPVFREKLRRNKKLEHVRDLKIATDALGKEKFHNNLQKRIRNRSGYRPVHANRNGGDVLVASYNVHKCVGQDNVFNPQRIIAVIEEIRPQILALQEVDRRFGTREGLLDLTELKERTGLVHIPLSRRGKGCYGLSHGFHGNALFLRDGHVDDIHQIDLPGMEPRGALIVDAVLKTGALRIIASHFGLLRHSRMRQVGEILNFLSKRPLMPTVMIGDLNEWRVGMNSSLSPLTLFFDVEMGTVPSFPSRFPVLALDRVFSFPPKLISSVEVHNTNLARIASDHLPLKAWIDLKGISLDRDVFDSVAV